jgi:hypothetical protein
VPVTVARGPRLGQPARVTCNTHHSGWRRSGPAAARSRLCQCQPECGQSRCSGSLAGCHEVQVQVGKPSDARASESAGEPEPRTESGTVTGPPAPRARRTQAHWQAGRLPGPGLTGLPVRPRLRPPRRQWHCQATPARAGPQCY